jgi:hypothetical protein
MSYKKWLRTVEPFEPEFQEPELLLGGLKALGSTVKKTLPDLCDDIQISDRVFADITGVPVARANPYLTNVILFAR